MSRPLVLAVSALLLMPLLARADVVVDAPYVHVRVGQSIVIRAPFVNLVLPRRVSPCLPKAAGVAAPFPVASGDPPPVPVAVRTAAAPPPAPEPIALSVKEFASTFKALPAGGKYEVVLQHPLTGKPVAVRFTLPPGTPKKITAGKLRLEFRFGVFKSVVIRFYRDGRVEVRHG